MVSTDSFDILHEDKYIIAINKPPGILVHKTRLSEDTVFLLQQLRNQIGRHVYTIHRLDRATSGVILFAKSAEVAAEVSKVFELRKVEKTYLAIVRGWIDDSGVIDKALSDEETRKLKPQDAITQYRCLSRSEIAHSIGNRYDTARFSLIECKPVTGRRHQIRKHLAHLRHPIIGDKKHGDVKQNKYFNAVFKIPFLCLHAHNLKFEHPFAAKAYDISAPVFDYFSQAIDVTRLTKGF